MSYQEQAQEEMRDAVASQDRETDEADTDRAPMYTDMDKCLICKSVGDHTLSCPTRWYR
jgi:hypothetical protein